MAPPALNEEGVKPIFERWRKWHSRARQRRNALAHRHEKTTNTLEQNICKRNATKWNFDVEMAMDLG